MPNLRFQGSVWFFLGLLPPIKYRVRVKVLIRLALKFQ
jgi:hypothetical protein